MNDPNKSPADSDASSAVQKQKTLEGEPPGWLKNGIWFVKNPLFLAALIALYLMFRITGHDFLCPILEKVGVKCAVTNTNFVDILRTNVTTLTNYVSSEVTDPKTLECVAYAKANQKPYWLESVTEIVHLQFDRTNRTRSATFQMIYVLKLLRDVQRNDRSFTEWFNSSDQRTRFTRISGSDEESVHGNPGKFDVELSGKAGEVRTVVTGGRFEWLYDALPRNGLGNKVRLGKNDDTWNYPNDVHDAIREYTMFLYSEGEEIDAVGQAGKWLKDGKLETVPHRSNRSDAAGGPAIPSLSARWENVFGEQEVAIHYSWPSL